MAGLTRKKVRVRGKSGKTYTRNMMVKTDALVKRHWKTAAKTGFAIGAASGAGMYAGVHAGLRLGNKRASKAYEHNKDSDAYHNTVRKWAKYSGYAGAGVAGIGTGVVATRRKAYKQMVSDIRRDPTASGRLGLIQTGASYVGGAVGTLSAWGAHTVFNRAKEWHRNRPKR